VSSLKATLHVVEAEIRDLKPGKYRLLRGRRTVLGHKLFVVGSLAPDGEYLIVVKRPKILNTPSKIICNAGELKPFLVA
jgi:hypothetical protein